MHSAAATVDVSLVDAARGRNRRLPAGPYQPLAAGDPVALLPGCQRDARGRTVRVVPATGRVRIARALRQAAPGRRDTAGAEGRRRSVPHSEAGQGWGGLHLVIQTHWSPCGAHVISGSRQSAGGGGRGPQMKSSQSPGPGPGAHAQVSQPRPSRARLQGQKIWGQSSVGTTDGAPAAAARSGSGRDRTTAATRSGSARDRTTAAARSARQPRPTRRPSIPGVFRRRVTRDRCTPERPPPRSRSRPKLQPDRARPRRHWRGTPRTFGIGHCACLVVVFVEAGLVAAVQIQVDAARVNRQAGLRPALDVHRRGDPKRQPQQLVVQLLHRIRPAREDEQDPPRLVGGDGRLAPAAFLLPPHAPPGRADQTQVLDHRSYARARPRHRACRDRPARPPAARTAWTERQRALVLPDQCALLTWPGACAWPTLVSLSSRYIPRLIATASLRSRHQAAAVRCLRSPADAITACNGAASDRCARRAAARRFAPAALASARVADRRVFDAGLQRLPRRAGGGRGRPVASNGAAALSAPHYCDTHSRPISSVVQLPGREGRGSPDQELPSRPGSD